ncbi:MAG TPA: helix-turn-helix domain-containing protein [Blastocatellia bacterium]|nr:helix-turn-helix domain-containing protein [Blastocatellia bacterium]
MLNPSEECSAFYRRFNSHKTTAARGTLLYPLPSAGSSLIFIQRGIVELQIICGRQVFPVRRLTDGDVFGDAPVLGMATFNARAKAVNKCRFLAIPTEVIQSSVLASHSSTLEWLNKVSANLADAQQEGLSLTFSTVRQRLAGLLLRLADKEGLISGTNHMALAGRLGVYRETVSARLREMKAEGILSVSREMIAIEDRKRLQTIATVFEGEPL